MTEWLTLNRSAVCLYDIPPITIPAACHLSTSRNDLPKTLCTTLDSVNPVLYPSIDTILIKLCVLLTMPVASATAEMPFSVPFSEAVMSFGVLLHSRLVHALLQSNNDRVAYIESFSRLSV
jgi:hypothetical protein